jgi:hypothetical protein
MATYSLWQESTTIGGDAAEPHVQHSNPLDVGGFVKAQVVAFVHAFTGAPTLVLRSAMLDNSAYYGDSLEAGSAVLALGINAPIVVNVDKSGENDVGLERFLRWEVSDAADPWTATLELHVLGYANS